MTQKKMTQAGAILCALIAFFIWVVVDAAIKLASEATLSPFAIMGIMGLASAASILGTACVKRDFSKLRPSHPREQILICLCSAALNYACVIALKHLPLTVYYIVIFTGPLAVALLVSLLKHETLTRGKILCIIAGFLGVVVAVGPRGDMGGEGIGYIAAFVAVAGFSLYSITIQRISKTAAAESIQLFATLSVGLGGILGAILQAAPVPGGKVLAMMAAAGLVNLLGNLFYNAALRHTSATNVAQTHYTQIISGAIIGYAIWHEVPTWNLVLGSVIIIVSGVVVAVQAHKSGTKQA